MRTFVQALGVVTGIAAIGWLLFVALGLAFSVAGWADDYTPLGWLALGATLVGTVAVARDRWWGALLIFGALAALAFWIVVGPIPATGPAGGGWIATPLLIMGITETIVALVLFLTRPGRAPSSAE